MNTTGLYLVWVQSNYKIHFFTVRMKLNLVRIGKSGQDLFHRQDPLRWSSVIPGSHSFDNFAVE